MVSVAYDRVEIFIFLCVGFEVVGMMVVFVGLWMLREGGGKRIGIDYILWVLRL